MVVDFVDVMSTQKASQIQLEVFYDGQCSLCRREIGWLKKKDREQRIAFVDIAAADFDASKYGKTWEEFMAEMHGRLPDGTWLVGLDTFDHLYRTLRLGWMVRWTRWPLFRPGADWAYRLFAKNRTWLTGRHVGSCRLDGTCKADAE